jgi:hypothetical protein
LGGVVPVGAIFKASIAVGQWRVRSRTTRSSAVTQTKLSTVPNVTRAREPSQLTPINATEEFPHTSVEALPVLQTNEKICVSDQ